MTRGHDQLNRSIRGAAGRIDPRELAAEAIAAAERAGDAIALRERIATDAGLPPAMGSRLQGQDAGELAADAKALAETLADVRPSPQPPGDMNARIRVGAGREAADGESGEGQA
jgi:hypothetical protein